MTIDTPEITYHFPADFDERAEYEMTLKGYLIGGEVELVDGRRFPITFFDPVRLAQDLESIVQNGENAFIEPGLVIIPEVSRSAILRALPELLRQHFFDSLRPLSVPAADGLAR